MQLIVTVLYVFVCALLVMVVLLQRGKEASGDLFGVGANAVLSSQGTTSFLTRLTTTLGILFFGLSILLGYSINAEHRITRLDDALASPIVNGAQGEKSVVKEVKDKNRSTNESSNGSKSGQTQGISKVQKAVLNPPTFKGKPLEVSKFPKSFKPKTKPLKSTSGRKSSAPVVKVQGVSHANAAGEAS